MKITDAYFYSDTAIDENEYDRVMGAFAEAVREHTYGDYVEDYTDYDNVMDGFFDILGTALKGVWTGIKAGASFAWKGIKLVGTQGYKLGSKVVGTVGRVVSPGYKFVSGKLVPAVSSAVKWTGKQLATGAGKVWSATKSVGKAVWSGTKWVGKQIGAGWKKLFGKKATTTQPTVIRQGETVTDSFGNLIAPGTNVPAGQTIYIVTPGANQPYSYDPSGTQIVLGQDPNTGAIQYVGPGATDGGQPGTGPYIDATGGQGGGGGLQPYIPGEGEAVPVEDFMSNVKAYAPWVLAGGAVLFLLMNRQGSRRYA